MVVSDFLNHGNSDFLCNPSNEFLYMISCLRELLNVSSVILFTLAYPTTLLKIRRYTIEYHLYKLVFHLRLRVVPVLVIVCLSARLKASSSTANFVVYQ